MNMQLHVPKNTGNQYCGPSAISAITGIGTAEAATVIRSVTGQRFVKSATYSGVTVALSKLGYKATQLKSSPDGIKQPTLAGWLKASKSIRTPGRVFLVCAGQHYQVISGRRYVCGIIKDVVSVRHEKIKRRARVARVWEVTKVGEPTFMFESPKRVTPDIAKARREAKRLCLKLGIELDPWKPEGKFTHGPEYWVPKPDWVDEYADPYWDGHLGIGWLEILERLQAYDAMMPKN